jgi:short-subunit dehydrogenase
MRQGSPAVGAPAYVPRLGRMFRLRGARILVTGASSGIGAATAYALARRHARLALCARRVDRLQSVAERCYQLGAQEVMLRQVDVGLPEEARAFVTEVQQQMGRIDVVINNAGVGWHGSLTDMPDRKIWELVQTNLLGYIWTTQAALPAMVEAQSGLIVNVGSVVGFRPIPYAAVYSATKHAVTGLSHALRGELSGTGVKVSTVYPGTTITAFEGRRQGGRFARTPEQVAKLIVGAVRWPRRDIIPFPYRLAAFAEPFLGGLLDHAVGEVERRQEQAPAAPTSPLPPEDRLPPGDRTQPVDQAQPVDRTPAHHDDGPRPGAR